VGSTIRNTRSRNLSTISYSGEYVKYKLCIDCTWAVIPTGWFTSKDNTRCSHPKVSSGALVHPRCNLKFCYSERDWPCTPCGTEGKLWEAK
jgi:hypothetical protein